MDSPTGIILSTDRHTVKIAVDSVAACRRCNAGVGCGAGLLSRTKQSTVIELPRSGATALRRGDKVMLSLQSEQLLQATLLAYGLPLAGMLLTLMFVWLLGISLSDGQAAICAALGLSLGFMVGRRRLGKGYCLQKLVPIVETPVNDNEQNAAG